MLNVSNVSLQYGSRVLFKEVNLSFKRGNCYGVIGANGAGKSTFLKILSGELEPNTGEVTKDPGERIAVLKQDHFAYENNTVLETVMMGFPELYELGKKRDELYALPEMTEEQGMQAMEIETRFGEIGGYEADSNAAVLLKGLGIPEEFHYNLMSDLDGGQKIRVLLAQALFGNPDILLLDEPTNHLDLETVGWLEDYLERFENIVIVVSHDRHFLNAVCTHTCDIDYGKINIYGGNYEFWYAASQLAQKQRKDQNRRAEEKIEELKAFIRRFASNAAKAKQATSRKKLLDKMTVEEMPASSRKFPWVNFKMDREPGKIVLEVKNATIDGGDGIICKGLNFSLGNQDKVALVGEFDTLKTAFFQLIAEETKAPEGVLKWGNTISYNYFPKNNDAYFKTDFSLVDWLRQYSKEQDETFIRGFLGRMLFTGEEALKSANVLSGGEKVRCMLSKMMLSNANCLLLDEPTAHLDLEAITALNNGLKAFQGPVIFCSQDHEFVQTIANRVLELTPNGIVDRSITFDEWLESKKTKKK
ncbi:ABC transporter ATP-binding protein [Fibrobacter sp. UWB4]|uniref:ABC-F family ATP-binding cassette domain-containing protein n=1 Tax=Fibrobacter sp. UWB4 TaxID=1964356 RepID=UPI000B522050|nr:ATP-binding cassette domain-containing protein [Fibrobacter sp. UWB4]MBO4828990.1 ATP-binding cassette domain-containing protein [Fibrobacter sp.]OWV20117.1 ABC transporter ATP-binding protein [Fibrobacter sp. UWB4]